MSMFSHAEITLKNIKNINNIPSFIFSMQYVINRPSGISKLFVSHKSYCTKKELDDCPLELYISTYQSSGHWGDTYLYSIGTLRARTFSNEDLTANFLTHKDKSFWSYGFSCEKLPEQILEIEIYERIDKRKFFIESKSHNIAIGFWHQYFQEEALPVEIVNKANKNYQDCKEYKWFFLTPG